MLPFTTRRGWWWKSGVGRENGESMKICEHGTFIRSSRDPRYVIHCVCASGLPAIPLFILFAFVRNKIKDFFLIASLRRRFVSAINFSSSPRFSLSNFLISFLSILNFFVSLHSTLKWWKFHFTIPSFLIEKKK